MAILLGVLRSKLTGRGIIEWLLRFYVLGWALVCPIS